MERALAPLRGVLVDGLVVGTETSTGRADAPSLATVVDFEVGVIATKPGFALALPELRSRRLSGERETAIRSRAQAAAVNCFQRGHSADAQKRSPSERR